MHYPLLEQDGYCASIAVEAAHGGRWKAVVVLERGPTLASHTAGKPISVPNNYPSNVAAAEAAYTHARQLIAQAKTQH